MLPRQRTDPGAMLRGCHHSSDIAGFISEFGRWHFGTSAFPCSICWVIQSASVVGALLPLLSLALIREHSRTDCNNLLLVSRHLTTSFSLSLRWRWSSRWWLWGSSGRSVTLEIRGIAWTSSSSSRGKHGVAGPPLPAPLCCYLWHRLASTGFGGAADLQW